MSLDERRKPVSAIELGEWVEVLTAVGNSWRQVKEARTVGGDLSEDGVSYPTITTLTFTDGSGLEERSDALLLVLDKDPTGIPNEPLIPEWDEYFLSIAKAVAGRAKCRRRQVGSVLVTTGKRIISTGYNGFAAGSEGDCLTGSCRRGLTKMDEVPPYSAYTDPTSTGFCPAIHAELNAILHAGSDTRGGTLYVTDKPCSDCSRFIAGAGIQRVVWPQGEQDPMDFYRVK